MPFVGFVVGIVVGVNAPHMRWFERGFMAWAAVCVLGLIFAGMSWSRKESISSLATLGVLLNVVLPLAFLATGFNLLMDWLGLVP